MSKYDPSKPSTEAGTEAEESTETWTLSRRVLAYWRYFVIILTPLLLLPLPIIWQHPETKCAYMIAIMGIYWVTEAVPLAVTSLIPIIAAPMLGLAKSSEICPTYTKDTIFLFMGGLMVAVCVEHWNLHKRIAIKVLMWVGTSPQWLMLGFMISTWFLSMWVSNTATTAMMIPIVTAVVNEMKSNTGSAAATAALTTVDSDDTDDIALENKGYYPSPSENQSQAGGIDELRADGTDKTPASRNSISLTREEHEHQDTEERKFARISKMMSLSVAYAANCGGIATLTGTPPNLVLKGTLDTYFKEEHGIYFSSWMVFGFPISVLSLLFAWVWLLVLFMGCKEMFANCCNRKSTSAVKAVIREEYKKLGPWSSAEITVFVMFIILALLWFFRAPGFIPGWGSLFKEKHVSDATAATSITILLFMIPCQLPNCRDRNLKAPVGRLLTWKVVSQNLPWNVVILLGGGFAMAETSVKSGLSRWVGDQLQALGQLPVPVIVLLLSTIIATLTEFTSNTATASLMLGIVAELAKKLCLNPLILMLPTVVAASFAFMLPVATPPNAIVFAYGNVRIKDMMIAGIVMNIVCILIVTMAVFTWGMAYFNLGELPVWANANIPPYNCTNATTY